MDVASEKQDNQFNYINCIPNYLLGVARALTWGMKSQFHLAVHRLKPLNRNETFAAVLLFVLAFWND